MQQSREPLDAVGRHFLAAVVLLVSGGFTLLVGWPRTVSCDGAAPDCDPTTGHVAFVWIGATLLVLALYPLMVAAAARGTALALRAAGREDVREL